MRRIRYVALVMLVLALVVAACGKGQKKPVAGLTLTSTAFENEGTIPEKYTCEGEDISPPLQWSNVPSGVKSFALTVEDPDAPGGTFVHWVIFDIPGDLNGLPENVPKEEPRPKGFGIQGINDFRLIGYRGPCPPPGKPHRYVFTLYALDTYLDKPGGTSIRALRKAMDGHILAQGQLVGMYGR